MTAPNVFHRDATPLPTDWDDLGKLMVDMRRHARENPKDEFIVADDPGFHYTPQRVPRLGWVAFKPGSENDFSKQWTITLENAKKTIKGHETLFRTQAGRQAHLRAIVAQHSTS